MESHKKVIKCTTHGWHECGVAGRCELCQAISQGDLEGVRRWLTPENMESSGRRGWTPLVFACRSGQVDIVKYLINAGAIVNAADKRGWTLLHHVDNSVEVVEILLEAGVDVNGVAKYGLTPLQVSGTKHANVVRSLLESGADVFALDSIGRSALPKFHCDVPQAVLLLEYFGDASVQCKRVGCNCRTTVLRCSYRRASRKGFGMYEQYIIKTMIAGFPLVQGSHHLIEPRSGEIDSFLSQTETFRSKCGVEFGKLASEKVPGTQTTYLSILHQNQSALRNPVVRQTLTVEHCNQAFPIYGETLRQRFAAGLRKLMLLDEAADSFEVHVPPLLHECITKIVGYLETEDLKNLLIVCMGRRNVTRLSQMPVSRICEVYAQKSAEASGNCMGL